ncbi:transmembrane protein 144b [Osmerus eperlanus]|uniref:transmembrane protein 144b n=1 Tax=Osmerus eperlanus TaxID=29151 RepID=UPI002E13CF39
MSTGNVAVVSIVKAIGLGLGVLIWGSGSLLMGWASSRFGWFGIDPQHVSSPLLNYCGAGLCFLSGLIFFFVRTEVETRPHAGSPLPSPDSRVRSGCEPSESWIEVIGPETKRLIGCSLATAYGLLDGLSFVPILYIKSRAACQDSIFYGASLYDPDYVYAQCCGIFLTSTVYFLIYCASMTNRPCVPSRAVLPGFASGFMWTLANYCWFLANIYLSSMVTFPIVTAGYGLVAALWGCLVFREIKGWGNCCILVLASCICLTGSILTALSKTQ